MNKGRIRQRLGKLLAVGFAVFLSLSAFGPPCSPTYAGPMEDVIPPPSLVVAITGAAGESVEIVEPGKTTIVRVTVYEETDSVLTPRPDTVVMMSGSWDAGGAGQIGPFGAYAGTTGDDGTLVVALRPFRPGSCTVSGVAFSETSGSQEPPQVLAWGQAKVFALRESDGLGIVKVVPMNAGSVNPSVGFIPPGFVTAVVTVTGAPSVWTAGLDMELSMLVPAFDAGHRETGVLTVRGEPAVLGAGSLFVMTEISLPPAGAAITVPLNLSDLGRLTLTAAGPEGSSYRAWSRSALGQPWEEILASDGEGPASFYVLRNPPGQLITVVDTPRGEVGEAIAEHWVDFGDGFACEVSLEGASAGPNELVVSAPSYLDAPDLSVFLDFRGQNIDLAVEGESKSIFVTPAEPNSDPLLGFFRAERGGYTFYACEVSGVPVSFDQGRAVLDLGREVDDPEVALNPYDLFIDPEPFVGTDVNGDGLPDAEYGYFPGCMVRIEMPAFSRFQDKARGLVQPWESVSSEPFPQRWSIGVEKLVGQDWADVTPQGFNDITVDFVHWTVPELHGEETSATYRLTVGADLGPAYGDMRTVHVREVSASAPARRSEGDKAPLAVMMDVIPGVTGRPIVEGDTVTMRLWAHWVPGSLGNPENPQDPADPSWGLSGVDFRMTYPKASASTVADSFTPVFQMPDQGEVAFFPGHWVGDVCEVDPDTGDHILTDDKHTFAFDRGTPVYPEVVTTDLHGNPDPSGAYESFRYVRYLVGEEPCSFGSGMLVEWQMTLSKAGEFEAIPVMSGGDGSMILHFVGTNLGHPEEDPYTIPFYSAPLRFCVEPRLGPVTIDSGDAVVSGEGETVVSGTGTPGIGVELRIVRSDSRIKRMYVPVAEDGLWRAAVGWWMPGEGSAQVTAAQRAYGQEAVSSPVNIVWDPYVPQTTNIVRQAVEGGITRVSGQFSQGDPLGSPPVDIETCWAIVDPALGVLSDSDLDNLVGTGAAVQVAVGPDGTFLVDVTGSSGSLLFFVRDQAGNQSSFQMDLAGGFPVGFVVDSVPQDGWTGVPTNLRPGVTFSRHIDHAVTPVTAALVPDTGPEVGVQLVPVPYGDGAVIVPVSSLSPNTHYTLTLSLQGEEPYTLGFTTGSEDDVSAPTATVNPAHGAEGVSATGSIVARFSESMNLAASYLQLFEGQGPQGQLVPSSFEWHGGFMDLCVTPETALKPNTPYFWRLVSQDMAGNPWGTEEAPVIGAFTTGTEQERLPSIVAGLYPPDLASGVPTNTMAAVLFKEPALTTDASATLTGPKDLVSLQVKLDPNTGETAGTIALPELSSETTYKITVSALAQGDGSGTQRETFESVFTTGTQADNTPPALVSMAPGQSELQPTDEPVEFVFSEPLISGTGLIFSVDPFEALPEGSPPTPVSVGTAVPGLSTLLVSPPQGGFAANTTYYWAFKVTDTSGNGLPAPDAIPPMVAGSFATKGGDLVSPTVIGTSPANETGSVGTGVTVTVTFSEAMSETGFAFTLTPEGGSAVPGTGSWNQSKTVYTFDPSGDLGPDKVHTIAVEGTDEAGNALTGTRTFTFTTAKGTEPAGTSIRVVPSTLVPSLGSQFTVDIVVADVERLAAADVRLEWSPVGALEAVDQDAGTPGIQVTPGSFLTGLSVRNGDNAQGFVMFSVASGSGTATGTGTLCTVTFQAKETGPVNLVLVETSAMDPLVQDNENGPLIPHSLVSAEVNIVSGGTVSGVVTPDGRSLAGLKGGGFKVLLLDASLNAVSVGDRELAAITGPDGSYSIAGVPAGTYTVIAVGRYYLIGKQEITVVDGETTTADFELLGGDANGDNKITSRDLLILAKAFGGVKDDANAPGYNIAADFNGDDKVTSRDLLVLAKRFGEVGQLQADGKTASTYLDEP